MTVYVDVLVIVNLYIDFFLLKTTASLMHLKAKPYRYIISSFIGGIFSLVILLPPMNFIVSNIIMIFSCAILIFIAFGKCRVKTLMKRSMVFYAVNFILAGMVTGLTAGKEQNVIACNNSVFYIDISLLTLIISTAAAYFFISLMQYIFNKKRISECEYKICLKYNRQTVNLKALADTGNSLTDIFSGKPIIICKSDLVPIDYKFKNRLKNIKNDDISNLLSDKSKPNGFKVIPYSTINSNGILPVFVPDDILIKEGEKQYEKVDALIGISDMNDSSYEAILNPKILV